MDLQNISNAELVGRMQKLVRTERKITHLILLHILEIESRRVYAELGYDGMYTYLTRGLGYSEASAYRRLQSARLLKQLPELAEKIESGALHLSQLTHVQKCIKASAEKGTMISSAATLEVLEKLENKNSFETDKVLAQAFDLPVKIQEVLKPQKDDSVRLEISLTAEQFLELEKAKEFLSHICFGGSWAEVISTLAQKFNQKHRGTDEVDVLASGNIEERKENEQSKPTHRVIARKVSARRAISARIRRSLLKKANSCCEYVNSKTGHRCRSRYQLQIDHVTPLAFGGDNKSENLRVLCRTHNLLAAKRWGLQVHSRDTQLN